MTVAVTAMLGWCLTGHHTDCPRTIADAGPRSVTITCPCTCHHRRATT